MADNTARQRRPQSSKPSSSKNEKDSSSSSSSSESSSIFSTLLKPILLAAILIPAMSYLIMDGESFTFGYHPQWATLRYWKTSKPSRIFTDAQLALYDGKNPELPILVGLNGSVFDVTANPATYGPGGGYNVFAGVDAARGFVTGCFGEDRNWDLRGVEAMFLELDEELDLFEEDRWIELVDRFGGGTGGEGDQLGRKGELSEARKKELRKKADERREVAWEKVVATIKHWDGFFRNHEKYFYVGEVRHRDISGDPIKKVCATALKKRPLKKKPE